MSNKSSNQTVKMSETNTVNEGDCFNELEALFSSARANEPTLVDDNFNKIVLNSLPAKPKRQVRRSWLFDAVGLLLGLVACALFFEIDVTATLNSVALGFLSLIPESLSLTLMNLVVLMVGIFGAAILAWWTTEEVLR